MHYVKPMYDEPIPTPLLAQTESSSSSPPPAAPTPARRSSKLDLLTMRICLLIESTGFAILALNVSSTNFVIVSAFLSLGTASSPAFNSLALSLLPSSREAGRLFGGLAVIHALAGTLISPLLFGTLFAATVGTYAPTVFALASTLLFIALVFVMCVRLPEDGSARTAERGRSRNVKRVKSSGAGDGVGGK